MTKLDTLVRLDASIKFERIVIVSTKQRYGDAVLGALLLCSWHDGNGSWKWATIGEVADAAGVSRTTAKKYLEALVDMGHAVPSDIGKRRVYLMGDGYGAAS